MASPGTYYGLLPASLSFTAAAITDQEIVAAQSGKRISIRNMEFLSDTAVRLTIKSGSTVIYPITPAIQGLTLDQREVMGLVGENLNFTTSAAATGMVRIEYWVE